MRLLVVTLLAQMLPGLPSASAGMSPDGIVNLRERGAAGDGTTDDTAAIVAAFASTCAAGGGTINVPSGVYIVDAAAATIPLCSHLVVSGTGTLRVKPDAGNYATIFSADPPSATVDDLTFTGITIDQNAAANTSSTIDNADPDTYQLIWRVYAGSNLHFEKMRLLVSGVDPIDVNGPAVSGVHVDGNYIEFRKRAGQPEFDNSSIYIDGDNFHVTDNTFVASPADAARTAIEIHTGTGIVRGNTIDGYQIGMNLVNLRSSSIVDNSIRRAGYGISLWSTTAMDSVVIAQNTVAINQVTRGLPSSWGISTIEDATFGGRFVNLQVSSNLLQFERESAPREMTGSANCGIGLQARGSIAGVVIADNQIAQPPVRGVVVGIADKSLTTSGVIVRDNRIVDAGSNFSSAAFDYSAAIALQGNLTDVDVLRNRLEFTSRPFAGHYALWSFDSGFTFRNVVATDNQTTSADDVPPDRLPPSTDTP
jgi:hypothetical protein